MVSTTTASSQNTSGTSLADLLSAFQNGVQAINSLSSAISMVFVLST